MKKLTQNLRKIAGLPLSAFNTRVRLAFGLACSVFTLTMLAQCLGLLPEENVAKMKVRKLQTETLALSGSALAESGAGNRAFEKVLLNSVKRTEDLISVGLRSASGQLRVDVGDHADHWDMPSNGRSNDRFMFVPIYRSNQEIGRLELCYLPLNRASSWLDSPVVKLAGFLFGCAFVVFNFLLYRTLKQLDPRGAVPRRVREAFDHMAEGLVILDRRGRIMLANGRFGAIVGVNADELTAREVDEFNWKQTDDELPWTQALLEQKSITEASLEIVDANGKLRMFSVSAAPILGERGSSRGTMVTFDDITSLEEHKQELIVARNEADAANEAKSTFLSRMSHEIRTPMNAIIGYTDILKGGEISTDDQVRYLTTIQSNGEHLLAVINDILDLSKVEAGQMTIERRTTQLVPMLTQVISTLNVNAKQKDLVLTLEIESKIPTLVETDETRLRQILINTIGNAIKFTTQGGVKLITRTLQQNDKTMLQFDIADTGIGMSAEALQKIFDPFTQADNSVTRRFGGTGLGLAISKQLAESLGGGIAVQSEEGVGTVFTITIDPGAISPEVQWVTSETMSDTVVPQSQNKSHSQRFKGGHVLVVDDAKANRDLARLMLKRLGVSCDTANNGLEALEKIAGGNQYDVVLMDMNMPVMDGMTATKHLRDAGMTLPIVALTAMAIESEMQKCINGGCSSFLSKPIRQEGLFRVLAEYLEIDDREPTETSPSSTANQPASESQQKQATSSAAVETSIDPSSDVSTNDSDTGERSLPSDLVLPQFVESSLASEVDFADIIADFADRLHDRLPEFESAFNSGSIKELNNLGHWLAGTADTVGFEAFVAPARELEYCDGSNPNRIADLLSYTRQLTDRIQVPTAQV